MQHHHRPGSGAKPVSTPPRSRLQAALRLETTSSASRSSADQHDQDRERGQARSRRSPARSSTSSEQNPGPIAISSAVAARRAAAARAGCPRGRAAPTPTTGCRSGASEPRVSATASAVELQRVLQRVDHLRAAGVADPPADVGAGQPVVGEEAVDVLAHVAADHRRAPRRRARSAARSRRRRSPSCARSRGRAGCGWPARAPAPAATLPVAPAATTHDGAVAEQPAGHQVGHRDVVALHGERAQLDGDQHGDLVGVADQVVVQPGDARPRRPRSRGRPAAPASRPGAARPARRSARPGTVRRAR